MKNITLLSNFVVSFALLSQSIYAQETNDLEEVIVTSHPLSAEGLAQANSVLQGSELQRELQTSLGATVARQPGVHLASFGALAGRPVIHGLDGARIRIMEDRIDSLDASTTSQDHATTIEPFIADRIEILKGSSALIYGSGAIGGVVDVHTGRIPHVLSDTVTGRGEFRYQDNSRLASGALRLDGSHEKIAWHIDAFARNADPYKIPDSSESSALHALEAAEEGHEDEHEDEANSDRLVGSQLKNSGGAFGVSWVDDNWFTGIAISTLNANYGLPGGHGHEEEHEEEEHGHEEEEHEEATAPVLDLKQTRIDIEAGIESPWQGVESINIRAGINDYQHQEIEPSGEVATSIENQAWESRIELSHSPINQWRGVLGLQSSYRDFSVEGAEAFTPSLKSRTNALFLLEERAFGNLSLELGARIENVDHSPETGRARDFTTTSTSMGLVWDANNNISLTLLADYSSRAPVGEELYSNGPHLATQSYEIGDSELKKETALNLSTGVRFEGQRFVVQADLYTTHFDDFINKQATGQRLDDLAVFQYRQDNVRFVGFDAQIDLSLIDNAARQLDIQVRYDQVSAKIDNSNEHLPRIPPQRYGITVSHQAGAFYASLAFLRHSAQRDISPSELPSDAYNDVRLQLSYALALQDTQLELFLNGNNLSDSEQRQHSSFIKDLAPMPGRNIEAGVRFSF